MEHQRAPLHLPTERISLHSVAGIRLLNDGYTTFITDCSQNAGLLEAAYSFAIKVCSPAKHAPAKATAILMARRQNRCDNDKEDPVRN
jgi:hypothetical protein